MIKKIVTCAFCMLGLISFSQSKMNSVDLSEVEITAQRAKVYPDVNRIISVIDKQEIEKLPVQNIDELLDRVAGLDVRQRGAGGVQADVNVRGGSFDQVLILLNGVNITDPQTGHYNLDIPVELGDISRIEILQGSAARIYGPNAFSGAINIVTGESQKNMLRSRHEAGSYGYLGQNVSGNFTNSQIQLFGSVSHKKSDGFTGNTDYKISNAFTQARFNTTSAGYFALQLSAQFKDYGANGFYSLKYPNQFESTKTFLSAFEWNYEKDFYTLNTKSYWRRHHDRFELFRDFENAGAWYKNHNYHQTDILGGKISANFDWKNYGKTTIGIDLRNEHIYSSVLGQTMETKREVPFEKEKFFTYEANKMLTTAMIDHTLDFSNWNFAGGVSTTFNKQFGTQTNVGIDISYKFNEKSRIFTSVNSAVRLPTFTDLYYQSATQVSNPNLMPEKSFTFEAGEKTAFGNLQTDAVVYYRIGKNVIDWVKKPEETKWESKNLTSVNAIGTDINAVYSFNNSILQNLNLAYSFLTLDKTAEGYDSKYALDYLRNKIVIGFNHKIYSQLSMHWDMTWNDRAGNYTDFVTAQQKTYKPYTLLGAKLMWNSKMTDVYFNVNNILNQNYVEFGGLSQPKINFVAGISLKI